MTWRSFTDFIDMIESEKYDSTYRNYMLDHWGTTDSLIRRAVQRIDNERYTRYTTGYLVRMIRMRLHVAKNVILTDEQTADALVKWYAWDRINKGVLKQYPYRRRLGNAI